MTGKERKFVDEYLVDLNAYEAARRAGYKHNTAKNAASWLKPERTVKPAVCEAVANRMAELSKRTGVTAERVLREISRVAFANITDAIDVETGKVRADALRDDTAAIQSVRIRKSDNGVECEVRFWDKNEALKMLGKYTSVLTDVIKVDGAVPVIIDDTGEDEPTRGRIGDE